MEEIKVGDVVRLNSGSPNLIVVRTDDGQDGVRRVDVVWLSTGGVVQHVRIPMACVHFVPQAVPPSEVSGA